MSSQSRIAELNDEIQVLSFNLADELDTLNFHSSREAVKDLQIKAFRIADSLKHKINDLLHNLSNQGYEEEIEEALEMNSLLEVLMRCSIEPESFGNFVKSLIPLIALLNKWGENGPVGI
ncbi:MAG TPA: hypothetical protein PLN69_03985 [bacterium]|nr:hypothetical protein [bacterium]